MNQDKLNPEISQAVQAQKLVNRRSRRMIYLTSGYILLLVTLILTNGIFDIFGRYTSLVYTVVIIVCQLGLFGFYYWYPYFFPIKTPVIPDHEISTYTKISVTDSEYYEVITVKVYYFIFLPLLGFFTIMLAMWVILGDWDAVLIFSICVSIFLIAFALFNKITVLGTSEELIAKWGPFTGKYAIKDVISIRPTAIKPVRQFLGWGFRVSFDGTAGFISGVKTGVKIDMQSGKKIVISSKNPQSLVNFVRSHREVV